MSQTELSIDFSGSDVASRRARAVRAFIDNVRRLVDAQPSAAQLQAVARQLEQLGLARDLFPREHFPLPDGEGQRSYRLAEDADGRFALYVSASAPGRPQPPHDHTTWAVIAGIEGNEHNVLYTRHATDDPLRERLEPARSVGVVPGVSVVLQPRDVHTIEVRGDGPGLHLHFYGLALDRLHERVAFEGVAGGTSRTFGAPRVRHPLVTPAALAEALADGEEIALLDVRETGVYAHRHLLLAASAPLWRIELLIDRLVPRRGTRVVLVDADESIAHEAAAKLVRLGWSNVSVLQGGTDGWEAAGRQVWSGTNVPGKAFGEVIEHEKRTPWIDVDELHRRVARGDRLVVVDSRTREEFAQFSLPFAHSLPGAELVLRIDELVRDEETLVVVNCAGRTRSIVGAQTLIDAGLPNPVVSLRNGTMDWLMAGHALAHGRAGALPEPGAANLAKARARAAGVAQRAGVRRIDARELAALLEQSHERTIYRFDIRTREEYEAGHLEGWRWAPGGQLVQAIDEYVGTRGARIVLADHDGVRALTTGAWLAQLGWDVSVWTPPALAPRVTGPEPVRVLPLHAPAASVSPHDAQRLLADGRAAVFDVDRRAAYEQRHVAGARFAVPGRLQEFIADIDPQRAFVLTSPDGVLASLVAAGLAARTGRDVRAITGGTAAWAAAQLPLGQGADGVLTGDDDHWLSPYALPDRAARDAGFRAYLDWELGLVAQLEREGDVGIRLAPVAPAASAAATAAVAT